MTSRKKPGTKEKRRQLASELVYSDEEFVTKLSLRYRSDEGARRALKKIEVQAMKFAETTLEIPDSKAVESITIAVRNLKKSALRPPKRGDRITPG